MITSFHPHQLLRFSSVMPFSGRWIVLYYKNVIQDCISTVSCALVRHVEIPERARLMFDATDTLTGDKCLHYSLHSRSC